MSRILASGRPHNAVAGDGADLRAGGPQVYDYRSLLLVLGESLGKERLLLPVPFAGFVTVTGVGLKERRADQVSRRCDGV